MFSPAREVGNAESLKESAGPILFPPNVDRPCALQAFLPRSMGRAQNVRWGLRTVKPRNRTIFDFLRTDCAAAARTEWSTMLGTGSRLFWKLRTLLALPGQTLPRHGSRQLRWVGQMLAERSEKDQTRQRKEGG